MGLEKRGHPSAPESSNMKLDDNSSMGSAPSITGEEVYNNALLIGSGLAFAGVADSRYLHNFLPSKATSPWDGELQLELRTWGWVERERPGRCDFRDPAPGRPDSFGLEKAFADLVDTRGIQGLDPKPSNAGGRTVCHHIHHFNSPVVINKPGDGQPWPPVHQQQYNVNGVIFTMTGAFYTIAVNRAAGFVAFIDRRSPKYAANDHWNRQPSWGELPALKHTSDVAWGLWNRRQGPENPSLGKIKYFLVGPIVNSETEKIIFEICEEDRAPRWPGLEFAITNQRAQALLGSPNGQAVGLFLAQHKRQMGGNHFVSKVHLFNSDGVISRPFVLFTVEGSMTEDQT